MVAQPRPHRHHLWCLLCHLCACTSHRVARSLSPQARRHTSQCLTLVTPPSTSLQAQHERQSNRSSSRHRHSTCQHNHINRKPIGIASRSLVTRGQKRRTSTKHLLDTKLVEAEVQATLLSAFLTEPACHQVDAQCGSGTYERLKCNPNNQDRIALPWSKREVCAIFGNTVLDKRNMM